MIELLILYILFGIIFTCLGTNKHSPFYGSAIDILAAVLIVAFWLPIYFTIVYFRLRERSWFQYI